MSELLAKLGDYYDDDTLPGERRADPSRLVEQVDQHVDLVCGGLPVDFCREDIGCAEAVAILLD